MEHRLVRAIRSGGETSGNGRADVWNEEDHRRVVIRTIAALCPVQLHVGPSAGATCIWCGNTIALGALQYDVYAGRSTIVVDDDCYMSVMRGLVEGRPAG